HLRELGVNVFIGHHAENVTGADVLIYSSAVARDNPELVAARACGIPIIPRAEMLGELMRLKYGVAVAGTHGKTTTSSMVARVLQHGGYDPTAVIGGRVSFLGSNARLGTGEYFVAEADESDGSFLRLPPTLAVVTNIDNDHLDHYGTMEALRQAFLDFINRVPFYGVAFLCADDANVRQILPGVAKKFRTYGLEQSADLMAAAIRTEGFCSTFTVLERGHELGVARLPVPGRHNVSNALAAISVGLEMGMSFAAIAEALADFGGVQRRFQRKGAAAGVTVVDDYGHHPSEVAATLAAARSGWPGPLWVVFQPHRYTRTRDLYREFGASFGPADRVFLLDIYAASETPIPGVSSAMIAAELAANRVAVTPARKETVAAEVAAAAAPGTLVLTLGAGDVYKCGEQLVTLLKERQ
ncbi:MAG TPA: UDP-N-acetylmuramate--L-alanine ligase, partial [bacterium]|nr:UDP-N-acetylmuramate--L-alanine ligase [bacterium]